MSKRTKGQKDRRGIKNDEEEQKSTGPEGREVEEKEVMENARAEEQQEWER